VGACSFDGYTLPKGVYGTALGLNLYDTAAQCGACVSITNSTGEKITAMVCTKAILIQYRTSLTVQTDRRRMSRWLRWQDIRPLPRRFLSPRPPLRWPDPYNMVLYYLPNHDSLRPAY
jgi:hypothetical protein